MKLAEALALRADLQRRLQQMRTRLSQAALIQDGETPPEDPQALLGEAEGMITQLTAIVARINRTNLGATLPDGTSVTDALARRDTLTLWHSMVSAMADAAANRVNRYSRTEIKVVATVDVAALRRQADDLARQRRELDTAIQATNWTVDLLE